VRGEYATPGELRHRQNWIGAPGATIQTATYVPPPEVEMKTGLSDLEKFIHAPSDLPALVRTGLIHYQFEAIHLKMLGSADGFLLLGKTSPALRRAVSSFTRGLVGGT